MLLQYTAVAVHQFGVKRLEPADFVLIGLVTSSVHAVLWQIAGALTDAFVIVEPE